MQQRYKHFPSESFHGLNLVKGHRNATPRVLKASIYTIHI